MTPTWQQKLDLKEANTRLILEWLELLNDEGKFNLVWSLMKPYTLPDLRAMNENAKLRIAAKKQANA